MRAGDLIEKPCGSTIVNVNLPSNQRNGNTCVSFAAARWSGTAERGIDR